MTTDIENVARAASEETVRRTFLTFGVDINNVESIRAFRADFDYARASRIRDEQLRSRGLQFILVTALGGVLSAFWLGFLALVGK